MQQILPITLSLLVITLVAFYLINYYPSLSLQTVKNFTVQENKTLPPLEIKTFEPYQYTIKGITLNITHPLIHPNIRWARMPILVKIDTATCNPSINEIRTAMQLWQIETDNVVSFKEVENNHQVWINCTTETERTTEGEFIITKVGEGGPTKNLPTDSFNLTVEAMARIVTTTKDCIKPVRILHEFGHVLGLDHVNDSKSIMYPYEDCQQDFTEEIKQTLKELYKIEALPDLYFVNATAVSFDSYLNVSFVVRNGGILTSPLVNVQIKGYQIDIKNYTIVSLQPNEGLTVWLSYIYTRRSFDAIILIIDPENFVKEFDEGNNRVVLKS